MNNMCKSVAIALECNFREIKNMLANAHKNSLCERCNKHSVGKTISRRDTKKEQAYGTTKHHLTILNTAKTIKSTWTREDMYEFIGNTPNVENFVNELKASLRADYNKLKI